MKREKYFFKLHSVKKAKTADLEAEEIRDSLSAGDAAENESRISSASKAKTADLANKILKGQQAKGSGLEDALKKAMKDNNISLEDNA